ncbi:MAG: bacterial extracellular solute-binding family protein [Devosia sp.]|uniref:extracellular solute-binding protein n=1 Tax=Devosia sp. TaxID=1871048 RepID=UPI00260A136D|nr:extracellular solute-binding protein [Devosia sp.]MDB5540299.1 bacterial extracellular solute-binding family protein [Devosia sp.]
MKRRAFMLSVGGVAAGMVLLPRLALAEAGKIDWYTGSDQNILDFWTNIVKPKFEAANPGITLNLVDGGDNAGLQSIAERAVAAMQTKTDPQADYFETFDPRLPAGGIEAGLWVNMKEAGLSNYSKVNPLAFDGDYSLPYRGSQVLLAYDTTKLAPADAPKTFADLVAWIKANPGQFIYNRPDKGGSGGNFVRRAIYEANGRDVNVFKIDNYTQAFGDETLGKGWEVLKDLAGSLFDNGAYTSGNTQSIQLLSQGAVTMIPAWSDQAIQAINTGVLPETTGLVQLTDLGLPGGFSRSTLLSNGVNKDASLKLADFILTEEIQSAVLTELGGFPGVSWDYISADLREKFKDVIPTTIPVFPGGDWEKAINDGWYRNVAPNVDRNA